jgi:hypothetical protein
MMDIFNPFTEYGSQSLSEEMIGSVHELTSSPEPSTNQSNDNPSQKVNQSNESSLSAEEVNEESAESSS